MKKDHYKNVAEAFGRQSFQYDEDERDNNILLKMRAQVREEVLSFSKKGDHILEINAGTGMDAVYFAQKGYRVTATDLSEGMIARINAKVESYDLSSQINVLRSAFHELSDKVTGPFDLIFSNMGGLNCEQDLESVLNEFTVLLKPGGKALLVIMPKACPWEWLNILKGDFNRATRRFQRHGTKANVENIDFLTFYYGVRDIKKILPENFKMVKHIGLASTLPQPHAKDFPEKHPTLFKILASMDDRLRHHFPFNQWADHIIFKLKKTN